MEQKSPENRNCTNEENHLEIKENHLQIKSASTLNFSNAEIIENIPIENDDFQNVQDLTKVGNDSLLTKEVLNKNTDQVQQISITNSDFASKFQYLQAFFQFSKSIQKSDGTYHLEFRCIKCLPLKRTLKTDSSTPLTNLTKHMNLRHTNSVQSFVRIQKSPTKEKKKLQDQSEIKAKTLSSKENQQIFLKKSVKFINKLPKYPKIKNRINNKKPPDNICFSKTNTTET